MEDSVNRDRLSELPDSLIHVILSFLSMRDVVSTSLLSKRWNNLWTTVTCLTFDDIIPDEFIYDGVVDIVRNFVNRALFMWNGTRILKFKITIHNAFDTSLSLVDDMDSWVRFAVKYNVQELEIRLIHDYLEDENGYPVPQCLYSCSSVRKLSLEGFYLQICEPPSWNQLKSLEIDTARLSELSSNQIMLGSPQLEVFELCLFYHFENLSIMSTSLKKLSIMREISELDISELDTVFRICCPNLETFKFRGCLYSKCLFTSISSLKYASLRFADGFDADVDELRFFEMFGDALRQVFSTCVEKVELSSTCALMCHQVVRASPKKYLISPSVKFLTLEADYIEEFGEMMDVLGIFPSLKMLVIEHPAFKMPLDLNAVEEFEANLSFLPQLKTIEILSYSSYVSSILGFIELLLKHAIRLEKLVFRFEDTTHLLSFVANLSFLPQLKTVEITSKCSDVSSIFGFIELLLKHAIRLEKLVFRFEDTTHLSSFEISEKLLSMPRSSPTAEVILMNGCSPSPNIETDFSFQFIALF